MRILSGIQPSGELHVGNYFGALRQHVELQEKGQGIYFIADYHSMTSVRDAAQRRRLVLDVALDYLACGLDPERSILYRQSDVPESVSQADRIPEMLIVKILPSASAGDDFGPLPCHSPPLPILKGTAWLFRHLIAPVWTSRHQTTSSSPCRACW